MCNILIQFIFTKYLEKPTIQYAMYGLQLAIQLDAVANAILPSDQSFTEVLLIYLFHLEHPKIHMTLTVYTIACIIFVN